MTATATSTVASFLGVGIVLTACAAKHPEIEFWDSSKGNDGALLDAEAESCDGGAACEWPRGFADAASQTVAASNMKQLGDPEGHCPSDMRYVEGDFCNRTKETCVEWLDPETQPARRCKRFIQSECVGKRVHRAFCIDTNEFSLPGETLPMGNIDANHAKELCSANGKRLCRESEWISACEGESMLPYSIGYDRPDGICNIDHTKHMGRVGHLTDYRVPDADMSGCRSPYGTLSQIGNVDEITVRDVSRGKYSIALHGGWWGPLRNRCTPATVAHSEIYSDLSLGFRCCSDAE
jgi:hypothetical protein